jgi:hypothetical protein
MTTPQLTTEFIKEKIDLINSKEYRNQRAKNYARFEIYNGQLEPSLVKNIYAEFKKPETINDLIHRMVPLNVVKKIVHKLAGIYLETPMRSPMDKNESDQELIYAIEEGGRFNVKMKEANRYFKLFKCNLIEPYVDEKGMICIRNIPRHAYEVFSHSMISPEIPDLIVKIIVDDTDTSKQIFAFWTANEFKIVNGKGEVDMAKMQSLQNPDGINPYGVLPFVYISEASYAVTPLPNDDLLRMGVLIPLLLTDLAFASKYQTWSIIYVLGYDGDIPASPNSVISLPLTVDGQKPEIGTVKPNFDMVSSLGYIESILDMLLVTNNLSSTGFKGQLSVSNPSSGIAKALDEAQSTEDKKDQQEFFLNGEVEMWALLSKNLIPVWRKQRMLAPEVNREFSNVFELRLTLREPRVTVTEQEQIEISTKKLNANLTTLRRELSALNPDLTVEEIEELEQEIYEERARKQMVQMDMMSDVVAPKKKTSSTEMDDEDEDEDEDEGGMGDEE